MLPSGTGGECRCGYDTSQSSFSVRPSGSFSTASPNSVLNTGSLSIVWKKSDHVLNKRRGNHQNCTLLGSAKYAYKEIAESLSMSHLNTTKHAYSKCIALARNTTDHFRFILYWCIMTSRQNCFFKGRLQIRNV